MAKDENGSKINARSTHVDRYVHWIIPNSSPPLSSDCLVRCQCCIVTVAHGLCTSAIQASSFLGTNVRIMEGCIHKQLRLHGTRLACLYSGNDKMRIFMTSSPVTARFLERVSCILENLSLWFTVYVRRATVVEGVLTDDLT